MAAYTSLLLGIALCATTAYSLECYTCETQTTNANCLTAINCSSNAMYCRTEVISGGIGALSAAIISKSCESSCTPSSSGFAVSSHSVTCCSTDRCNTSGGASIRSSYAAIVLALGSILTVLKSSVL